MDYPDLQVSCQNNIVLMSVNLDGIGRAFGLELRIGKAILDKLYYG